MDEKKQRQRILVGTALAFLLFIDLLPYLWLLISSFRASNDPFTNSVLPGQLTLSNYANIFRNANMLRPFFNSLGGCCRRNVDYHDTVAAGCIWFFSDIFLRGVNSF